MKKQKNKKIHNLPFLGFGIGLRLDHYQELLEDTTKVDWLEIISENFLLPGGRSQYYLDQFNEKYQIIPHGVSLSIGSTDPLNWDYLKKLKNLLDKTKAPWFSDHLCWSHHNAHHLHNLMPLPYTEENITYIAKRIEIIQEFLERPMLIENVSSYVEFTQSTMPEWTFIKEIAEKANCGLLLDVNNVFVSAFNHHYDPMDYIHAMPPERVIQYHIAGHHDHGTYILDTHDHDIRDEVWDLFKKTAPLFGNVSTMIERDDNIPPLEDLLQELNIAKQIWTDHV